MGMISSLRGFILGFSALVLFLGAVAQAGGDYDYPYKDPYLATFSSALLKGRNNKQGVRSEVLKVWVLPGRDNFTYIDGRGYLSCRLYAQKNKKAPLMIIIPGLGSSAHIGNGTFLADQFYLKGFHVLVVPNPMNWNFTLAASESGLTGVTPADVGDLQRALRIALKMLREEEKLQIDKIGVIGISLGALETAFLSVLEKTHPELGTSRYLAINPAVDLKYGITVLDRMSAMIQEVGGEKRAKRIRDWAFEQLADSVMDGDPTDPEYFKNVDKRYPFKREEFQYLLGFFLKAPISESIYISQLIEDRGLLHGDPSKMRERIKEASQFSAMDYVQKFIFPHFAERSAGTPLTADDLMSRSSLTFIENDLRGMTNFFVMDNEDDFLLRDGDMAWLRGVFGSRLKTYPLGGHVGNIWFEQNKNDILSLFADWAPQQH